MTINVIVVNSIRIKKPINELNPNKLKTKSNHNKK